MFGIFKKQRIKGLIAYFGLQDWWMSTFTKEEKAYIIQKYQPLGMGGANSLTEGDIISTSETPAGMLNGLSSWFNNKQDREIAMRILEKANELSGKSIISSEKKLTKGDAKIILDKHFLCLQKIKTYYPQRDTNPKALERAISACRDQINLAPIAAKAFRKEFKDSSLPSHTGYKQLSIIFEKQKSYQEALILCQEALKAKWSGDWEKRISRLNKKLKNAKFER